MIRQLLPILPSGAEFMKAGSESCDGKQCRSRFPEQRPPLHETDV
jgi:hypothetical protein